MSTMRDFASNNDNINFGSDEESERAYDCNPKIDFSVLKGTKYKRMFMLRYERPHLSRLQAGKRAVARMWGSALGARLKLPAGGLK